MSNTILSTITSFDKTRVLSLLPVENSPPQWVPGQCDAVAKVFQMVVGAFSRGSLSVIDA